MSEQTAEQALFDEVEIDDSALADIPEDKRKPTMGDEKWTEHMLSFLTKKEFTKHNEKEYPTTAGLRRLCTSKFGKILRSVSSLVDAPSENNGYTATVEHELLIREYGTDDELVFTGVADANARNTDPPYNRFLSPNASTKALGRALRDAMQLQIAVAEELSKIAEKEAAEADDEDFKPIESAQKKAIEAVSKKLGIDVDKLINLGKIKFGSIDELSKGKSRSVMSLLNRYQAGTDIPDNIKK